MMKRTYRSRGLDGSLITREEWDRYYDEKEAFDKKMEAKRPDPLLYSSPEQYCEAMEEWRRACSMDAPNEPGYYRANND